MSYFAERRKYLRCTETICKTLMSPDKRRWGEIELDDISGGGLRFKSKVTFEEDTPLKFNLCVYNMLSEFKMNFEGHIVRKDTSNGTNFYGVKFDNINKYLQVQLDEIIKSKVKVKDIIQPVSDDGIYTFLFIPRIRSKRIRMYR
jgi:c-di-GMP-binding flagellar brake protein YcgR